MRVTYINLLEHRHPLCFSLAAYEEVLSTFGSMENLYAALTSDDLAEIIHGLDKLLPILMRAGRIYAAEIGEQLPPELKCRPLDVLDASDPMVLGAVISAIQKGTSRTVETVQKNGEATPGQ